MCYFLFLLFQFMLIFIISGLVILGYCSKVCVSSEPVFFRIFFISISYRSTCFSFDDVHQPFNSDNCSFTWACFLQ